MIDGINYLVRIGCKVTVTADELYPPHTTFTASVRGNAGEWSARANLPISALETVIAHALQSMPPGSR